MNDCSFPLACRVLLDNSQTFCPLKECVGSDQLSVVFPLALLALVWRRAGLLSIGRILAVYRSMYFITDSAGIDFVVVRFFCG